MFNSSQPHGLQHTRPPCPSPTLGVYTNSCPLSWWCHPTISSSVIPFSSQLQSFPASGSFSMSQFFASGGQTTGVSASASVLPMNIQDTWLGYFEYICYLPHGIDTDSSQRLDLIAINFNWSIQPWSIVQRESPARSITSRPWHSQSVTALCPYAAQGSPCAPVVFLPSLHFHCAENVACFPSHLQC